MIRRTLVLTVLIFLAAPLQVHAQKFEKKEGITFSNIAPGEFVREAYKDFPVKIAMVSTSRVPYAGVYIRVFNASGVPVFKHLCEKPWLFLKLPAGEYHVVGVDRNKVTRIKYFKAPKEGKGQKAVKLKWPKDVVGY